ncbi:oxygen-independent coproporphyrinogen-3 oxidase [Altererythrobacter atlanticus]|uniref:Coproporphyrinogen-III oxidase n=1 Tax=Croceibacterium atlanticum TaxID=1267766 RepID=A0A0F7KTG2_9SPHN|nr:oxygen-independent coproporphyrinogen III oxidase [Croceibacterium atlanticum]AKH42090.1 Oxygen-independent coproporphyrinogen-III oxidase [Croceibacterium atlanticum]MBB5733341.1 oxygen-independent coproporphyrinogen-3 oxidase [Croceibacterium atlanticum]
MWPYHPELLATPVPRYTSFPTAAEFGPGITPEDHARALANAHGDISLYLHIPFCEKICWYCGCNTGAANRKQRLASYLDSLHTEIALVSDMLPRDARIRRIAFGGGSPNAIAPTDFARLFDELLLQLPLDNPTVSIELDPRTLTREWTAVLRAVGATHASLGVQTFAPHLQEAIGRVQPLQMIEQSVEILRAGGVNSMNFDLMYGLPGQSDEDLRDSLERAAGFEADRIALFGYAHVPHLLPRQRKIDASALPGPDERFHMAESGHDQLVDEGYVAVGFDHFALPGDPLAQAAIAGRLHRNFQGFTEDPAKVLIGLGASAISSFPELLVQNDKNSGRYRMSLSQNRLPTSVGKVRSADDQRRGAIIEALLCSGKSDVEPAMLNSALDRLQPYLDAGLCVASDGTLEIVPRGLPYARSIAASFDPYRQHSLRRFSSAV